MEPDKRQLRKLKRDLEGFVEDAEGADVAIIYYSGHGIEAASGYGGDYLHGEAVSIGMMAAARRGRGVS